MINQEPATLEEKDDIISMIGHLLNLHSQILMATLSNTKSEAGAEICIVSFIVQGHLEVEG